MFAFGFTFADLYTGDGLARLDAAFAQALRTRDVALFNRLMAARAEPDALSAKEESELILALAPHVEDFTARLFRIEQEAEALRNEHLALNPLYACKRLFVQRKAAKAYKPEEVMSWPAPAPQEELAFATNVMRWQEQPQAHVEELLQAQQYAAWALYAQEGKKRHRHGVLFKLPEKLDAEHLIPVETEIRHGVAMLKLPDSRLRAREGFALTDPKGSLTRALDEAHYCIYCAHQGKDSCSKGFKERDMGSEVRDQEVNTSFLDPNPRSPIPFKKNALGATLAGCPLEEKISEMNELKAQGFALGALAVVTIDNPLCAGTGHRICNDCMKACIYQKQQPVDIPLNETRVLDDVLKLPYGFEIYALFTRWNPLNLRFPLPKPESGYNILVAGMGPAGYTLSHYLLNEGHTVVGIDGLKIEPVDERFIHAPIKDISVLQEPLDTRTLAGFGGVAEYGITVRWDKNYLKIIRLLLERRARFALHGGVRFGAQITYDSAWALGFDHIALCMGAGKPNLLGIPNGLARGVRTASDFLMSLQLTGAAKADSIANLQLRLPVVVVGGGLTAIDTATEALAYYPLQVEKFLARYETLGADIGWDEEERVIAQEFIAHARAIRAEKAKPNPDVLSLLKSLGGVTVAYRKRLADSPGYRLNHEEVEKGLEEGVFFAENLEPVEVEVDAWGHISAVRCESPEGAITLPAKALLIAAGTNPNTVLAREDPAHFMLDGKWFRAVDAAGRAVSPQRSVKPAEPQVLMSVEPDGRAVSFFGDLHPSYAGNVVKAMASARQGYKVISNILLRRINSLPLQGGGGSNAGVDSFLSHISTRLSARVHTVNRLTPTIVEVVLHAPLAAKEFRPGQFYRLQNFERFALKTHYSRLTTQNTTLAMEGLAMTGAWVDKERGLVSVIALEMGGSSDLCIYLKPGEPVVLMGPTGAPTEIPGNETVLLAGGGLGNAVLFSIGAALRQAGSGVLYFAAYRKLEDRYKVEEIERAADMIIWCCDEGLFTPSRPQDRAFHGNIIDAMAAYAEGKIPPAAGCHTLNAVNRVIAIGSAGMMAAVGRARHTLLKPHLNAKHVAIGSINSPMQCMMKEICAQCLQEHKNPQTGEMTYVYSCFNQDQCLDEVSFPHLEARLRQNSAQEKLTAEWIKQSLEDQK